MAEFDAPIAGMSLTSELGGRPWQKPAKNIEVEDAINEFIPQICARVWCSYSIYC